MNSQILDYIKVIGLLAVLGLALSWISLQVEFPYHEAGLSTQLLPTEPYKGIAPDVSRFMWESRGLDIALQSFVIFASVVCCLAMLKEEVPNQ